MSITDSESTHEIDLDYAIALAIRLHQSEHLEEAETAYKTILAQVPDCPEALLFYGMLQHQKGENEQAISLIEQAIENAPNYYDAYNNLGNIFNKLGQLEKAAENYRKAMDLNPENALAYSNFGVVSNQLGNLDDAIDAFTKAVTLMPNDPDFYQNLGNAFKKQGNFVKSIEAYRKVLSLKPYNPEHYENLCRVLYLQGSVEEAILLIKQWLEFDPENPLALHRLSSYTGKLDLPRAADAYITQTFDSFADSFDMVLKKLEYKAPFIVTEAVKQIYPKKEKSLTILDAGCGTGLCGPLLEPFASQIVGVDLSAKMLEKAKDRDCYADLYQSELTAFIATSQKKYDLIVSADTLVYFGDLQPVCLAVAKTLLPGGYFVFTVERTEDEDPSGYKIHAHGRFSHNETYLRSVIQSAEMLPVKIDKVMLRYEAGVPVDGFLVVAKNSLA